MPAQKARNSCGSQMTFSIRPPDKAEDDSDEQIKNRQHRNAGGQSEVDILLP
jgi:hypothetical protein